MPHTPEPTSVDPLHLPPEPPDDADNTPDAAEPDAPASRRIWVERLLQDAVPEPAAVGAWVEKLRGPDDTPATLARRIGDRLTWLQATQGAALALPGALPGLGTAAIVATEAGAITAELGLLLKNQAWMSAGMAHAYGLPADRDVRYRDALFTLGLWCGVVASCPRELGKTMAAKQVKKVPHKVLKKVAMAAGKAVVTKLGAQRGAVALGKLVPFGIGAVVGGGFSFAVMRSYQRTAEGWYAEGRDGDLRVVEAS